MLSHNVQWFLSQKGYWKNKPCIFINSSLEVTLCIHYITIIFLKKCAVKRVLFLSSKKKWKLT